MTGNAKGIVAAIVSVVIFNNAVSFIGSCGYFITILGVAAYSFSKSLPKRRAALALGNPAQSLESAAPLLDDPIWAEKGGKPDCKQSWSGRLAHDSKDSDNEADSTNEGRISAYREC